MQRFGSRGDETPPHRLRVPALSPAEADHRRPDHRVRPTAASATSAANTEAADRAVKAEIARLQNEIGHILSEEEYEEYEPARAKRDNLFFVTDDEDVSVGGACGMREWLWCGDLDQPSTPTSSAHAPLHTLTQCEFISGCSDPKVDDEAFEDFQIPEPPTPETPVDGDKARGADGKMAPPSVVLHCAQRWRTRDGPDAAKRLLPVRIVMGNGAVGQQTNAAY